MGESSESVLKRDVVGRVVTPCAKREELLDEFERSALSGAEFARLVGVKYQTFAGWVQRRRHARGAYGVRRPMTTPQAAAAGLRLVEAVVASTTRPAPMAGLELRIDLPGGASVTVGDSMQAALAAQLLKALATSSPC
jgi:hypothetical protein